MSGARERGTRSRGVGSALLALVVGLVTVVPAMPLPGRADSHDVDPAATSASPTRIEFDGTVFVPEVARVEPGTTVLFANMGPDPITVEEADGRFSLAPIPPGGGAVLTLSDTGVYTYSNGPGGAGGRVLVGSSGFDAPATDPIADHIPVGWFPEDDPSATHPVSASEMYTSRILVRFVDGATVADAEEALLAAGAAPVGGLPSDGIVAALIAGTADFGALDAALDVLRSHPSVRAASEVPVLGATALPPPEEALDYPFEWEVTTTPDGGLPFGKGLNWGAEASRFPQAWNLASVAEATGNDVTTVVLDVAFVDSHPDVAGVLTMQSVCNGSACSATDPYPDQSGHTLTHGSAVTSLAAAPQERPTGVGLAGANPSATVIGLMHRPLAFAGSLGALLDRVEEERAEPAYRQGPFADVRVVNASLGDVKDAETWAGAHRELTCGPGYGDDEDAGSDGPCLPWTDDDEIARKEAQGMTAVPLLVRASRMGITIVHSAGNDANKWCIGDDGRLWGRSEATAAGMGCTDTTARPSGRINTGIAWAGVMWDSIPETLDATGTRIPNPVVMAVSYGNEPGTSLARSLYSQVDGPFSAPGWTPVPRDFDDSGTPTYGYGAGTSYAAPLITGVLGYMLSLDPTLTIDELRSSVATFADTWDPIEEKQPAPRIDAFGSLLALDGAVDALLDVDDGTVDGNRRVVYGPGGALERLDTTFDDAEPIGAARTIDMADFRRYRDAWLDVCSVRQPDECAAALGVGIALDGGDGHPKRDLNLDGCAPSAGSTCQAPEDMYPRVDFNGDGIVSRVDASPIPLDATSQELTDLEVLASRFQPAADGEGWYAPPEQLASLLDDLLVSGDVEVNVAGLRLAGATDLSVELIDGGVSQFVSPIESTAPAEVVTVPAGREVELVVRGDRDGTPVSFSEAFTLAAGEDRRYDPCGVLRLSSDFDAIPFGGETVLSAWLEPCDDVDVSGISVDFQVVRDGGGSDATLTEPTVQTDAEGRATTTLVAGENPGTYYVTATSQLPILDGAVTVESTVTVVVTEGYRLETVTTAPHGVLGRNPSIGTGGSVMWTARSVTDGPFDLLYRTGSRLEPLEVGANTRAYVEPGTSFGPRVDVAYANTAYLHAVYDNQASEITEWKRYEWALEVRGTTPSSLAEVVRESIFSGTYLDVGLPTANAFRDPIVPLQLSDELVGRLGHKISSSQTDLGPSLDVWWPRHADDGETVGTAGFYPVETTTGETTITNAVVVGQNELGVSSQAIVTPLAVVEAPDALEPTGWTLLGDKPDISSSGDVVVFVGDRGDGPAVHVSVRTGEGTYTEPLQITGAGNPFGPELGAVNGDPRYLSIDEAAGEHDLNVGVVQQPVHPEGPEGDRVVVAVFGKPDGPGTGYEGGLFTIPVTIGSGGALIRGVARSVVQLGDTFDADPVEAIGWHRVVADDGSSDDPADHRLAVWIRTANGERIVRAVWVGAPSQTTMSGVSFVATRETAESRPLGLAYPDDRPTADLLLDDGDEPVELRQVAQVTSLDSSPIPGLVVSDLSPESGSLVTVVNRSSAAGEFVDATLLVGQDTIRLDPGEQHTLQVDSENAVLTIEAYRSGVTVGATLELAVAAPVGSAPVADAGGPYSMTSGQALTLDASGSTDDGTVVEAAWDLDGDGFFDDADGIVTTVEWPPLADAFCGGSCVAGVTRTIGVRVTDDDGITAEASTAVEVAVVEQDFTLALVPVDQLVNPGSNVEYRVEVGSVGGFTQQVQLSVDPLPDGFNAALSRTTVTAPGSATLTVYAPQDAPEAPVSIDVTGTSGDLVHSTSGEASVVFGLIPICYEPVSGVVVDKTTLEPLAGVTVRVEYKEEGSFFTRRVETTTAADGTWEVPDIPEYEQLTATALGFEGYHSRKVARPHRCGDPAVLTLEMTPWEFATVRGSVVEALTDPTDTSRHRAVFPTDDPVPGATVDVTRATEVTADETGGYSTPVLLLSPDNGDIENASVRARAAGFWPGIVPDLTFSSGPALEADVPVVRACTLQVGAFGRVTDQNGDPIEGRTIRLLGSGGPERLPYLSMYIGEAVTDADGRYEIPLAESYLGPNNSAFSFRVDDASSNAEEFFTIDRCGVEHVEELDLQIFVPPPSTEPVENFGTVSGFVVDAETGLPIEGARVRPFYDNRLQSPDTHTDADGHFTLEEVFVGEDDVTLRSDFEAVVTFPDYYGDRFGTFTVLADSDSFIGTLDVVPIHYATLEGRILDVVTGEPVSGASVSLVSYRQARRTDENGFYRFDRLELPKYNQPYSVRVDAHRTTEPEYFGDSEYVDLYPDQTTIRDIELLAQCYDVTIRGVVVDAVTGDPIEGARLDAGDATEYSDADGRFLFEGLSAGGYNRPNTLYVSAQAEGYYSQTRRLTVYCGATLTVNFGVDTGSGSVLGTVTDTNGDPIRSVRVVVETGGSDSTDSAGEYRIDDVPLGIDGGPTDWTVTAIHQDGRTLDDVATVTDGGETVVDFVFEAVEETDNEPPTVSDLAVSVDAGSSVQIGFSGSDPDFDELTYEIVDPPSIGSVTGEPPAVTYSAPEDAAGEVTFTYRAFDGTVYSEPGTVTITVVPVEEPENTLPIADDLTASVDAGSSVEITLSGSDADGDTLSFEIVDSPSVGTLTGEPPVVTYSAPEFEAGEVTFTYRAFDGTGYSDPATVTITIVFVDEPQNSPPVVDDLSVSVDAGSSVEITLSGSDADGDTLSFEIVDSPSVGTLTGEPPVVTYSAPEDAAGETTFTYRASDGTDHSAAGTVTVTILPVEEPDDTPPAIDPIADVTMSEGDTLTVGVTAADPDGDLILLTADPLPPWAELTDAGDGTGSIELTPPDDAEASIEVEACALEACVSTTFTVTVENVAPTVSASNDGPVPWGVAAGLEAEATDPSPVDQATLTYRWDVDGDGTFDTEASADPSASVSHELPGEYPASVEVCDDDVCVTAETTVVVTTRPVTVSDFVVGSAQYSDPVSLSATLIDGVDGTPIADAEVEFGFGPATAGATTGETGVAAASIPVEVPAGPVDATVGFTGNALYDAASAERTVEVVQEDATLVWRGSTVLLGNELVVEVDVIEAADGALGDIELAAVTFSLFGGEDCSDPLGTVAPVPVDGGDVTDDGMGIATAFVEGVSGEVCVTARLTDPADPAVPNGHYRADPVEAEIELLSDGHVTGGGTIDGTADRLSVGFEARVIDGVLSGSVEVVGHPGGVGPAEVLIRSTEITSLSISDAEGTGEAPWRILIRGMGERRVDGGWETVELELHAVDGGPGRDVDELLVIVDGEPYAPVGDPAVPGPLSGGQIVVHLPSREELASSDG